MKTLVIRTIVITSGVFCLGLIVSALVEYRLRQIIQSLFKNLTNGAIHFYGKDFHLFASVYYYLSFGMSFLVFLILYNGSSLKQRLIGVILAVGAFLMAVTIICWFEANRMIVECTACHDGTRGIHYNDINYDGVAMVGLLVALIPGMIRVVWKRRSADAGIGA